MSTLDVETRVTFEALTPFFKRMNKWAVFTIAVPLTAVLVLWPHSDPYALIGWFLAVLAGIGAKYLLTARYHRQPVNHLNAQHWHLGLLLSTAYLGMLWIVALFSFFAEDSAPHQVFLITLAVTLGIGSITSGTHWLPLFYVYGAPILLALSLRLAIVGSVPYLALACLMIITFLAAISIARQLNSVFRSKIKLHYSSAELAKELQIKTEEAQQAVLAKSGILATASHDLRQPLHAISLYLDALRNTAHNVMPEGERIFDRLDTCLILLRKQFDAIFEISRLDANVVQPERQHFDIAECLAGLYTEYRQEALKRKLSLRLRAPGMVVYSDRALLERVLRNLITNALLYTRTGGVLIAVRQRQDEVLIQVIDTGVGIPQEQQEKAFTEFQQLGDNSRDRDRGLGFGLAIVRRLCEVLGHPLTLSSRVYHGSTFSLRIPRGDPALIARTAIIPGGLDQDGEQKLVLVVDDDPSILDAMQTLLSNWGLKILVAESLQEMLQTLPDSAGTPDLILSDLNLHRGPDGIGTIRELRARFGANIPAVLISGSTDRTQLQSAEATGLRLIQKPISPSELRSVIQHQLFVH